MPIPNYPAYEYAIQRPCGQFYTGSVHGDHRDWCGLPGTPQREPFKYTEAGAHKKIATFPDMFKHCRVVRIS